MTDAQISTFIDNHEWTFAKTMPEIPHWYTLRRKAGREEDFVAFVQEIRVRGVPRQFGKKSFTYLDLDGWTYWTIDAVHSVGTTEAPSPAGAADREHPAYGVAVQPC